MGTALKAHNQLSGAGEPIDEFALALVAALAADNREVHVGSAPA
jgi:hypothetical protein